MPAVINFGMPTVSSGSQITTLGSTLGWKMIFFSCVSEFVITLARPTSEPVPAVVGTATIGKIASASARVHQSPMSSKSQTGRDCPAIKATILARSNPDPPPKATTPSCPPSRNTANPASKFFSLGFVSTSANLAGFRPPCRKISIARSVIGKSANPRSVTKRGFLIPAARQASPNS